MSNCQFVGVDGCAKGWFSIGIDSNGSANNGMVFTTFQELLNHHKDADLILVDIPIGFPDNQEIRQCDKQAIAFLNENGAKRGSSVFRTPTRAVVEYFSCSPCYEDVIRSFQHYYNDTVKAICHKDVNPDIAGDAQRKIAKQIRYATSRGIQREITGKSLSEQTLEIVSKMAEVDIALSDRVSLGKPEIREVHPEICFWGLNKCSPMKYGKKKKEGAAERLEILQIVEPWTETVFREACAESGKIKGVEKDDILDALVAAVTAYKGWNDRFYTLPENPEYDSKGLPMEMLYWRHP